MDKADLDGSSSFKLIELSCSFKSQPKTIDFSITLGDRTVFSVEGIKLKTKEHKFANIIIDFDLNDLSESSLIFHIHQKSSKNVKETQLSTPLSSIGLSHASLPKIDSAYASILENDLLSLSFSFKFSGPVLLLSQLNSADHRDAALNDFVALCKQQPESVVKLTEYFRSLEVLEKLISLTRSSIIRPKRYNNIHSTLSDMWTCLCTATMSSKLLSICPDFPTRLFNIIAEDDLSHIERYNVVLLPLKSFVGLPSGKNLLPYFIQLFVSINDEISRTISYETISCTLANLIAYCEPQYTSFVVKKTSLLKNISEILTQYKQLSSTFISSLFLVLNWIGSNHTNELEKFGIFDTCVTISLDLDVPSMTRLACSQLLKAFSVSEERIFNLQNTLDTLSNLNDGYTKHKYLTSLSNFLVKQKYHIEADMRPKLLNALFPILLDPIPQSSSIAQTIISSYKDKHPLELIDAGLLDILVGSLCLTNKPPTFSILKFLQNCWDVACRQIMVSINDSKSDFQLNPLEQKLLKSGLFEAVAKSTRHYAELQRSPQRLSTTSNLGMVGNSHIATSLIDLLILSPPLLFAVHEGTDFLESLEDAAQCRFVNNIRWDDSLLFEPPNLPLTMLHFFDVIIRNSETKGFTKVITDERLDLLKSCIVSTIQLTNAQSTPPHRISLPMYKTDTLMIEAINRMDSGKLHSFIPRLIGLAGFILEDSFVAKFADYICSEYIPKKVPQEVLPPAYVNFKFPELEKPAHLMTYPIDSQIQGYDHYLLLITYVCQYLCTPRNAMQKVINLSSPAEILILHLESCLVSTPRVNSLPEQPEFDVSVLNHLLPEGSTHLITKALSRISDINQPFLKVDCWRWYPKFVSWTFSSANRLSNSKEIRQTLLASASADPSAFALWPKDMYGLSLLKETFSSPSFKVSVAPAVLVVLVSCFDRIKRLHGDFWPEFEHNSNQIQTFTLNYANILKFLPKDTYKECDYQLKAAISAQMIRLCKELDLASALNKMILPGRKADLQRWINSLLAPCLYLLATPIRHVRTNTIDFMLDFYTKISDGALSPLLMTTIHSEKSPFASRTTSVLLDILSDEPVVLAKFLKIICRVMWFPAMDPALMSDSNLIILVSNTMYCALQCSILLAKVLKDPKAWFESNTKKIEAGGYDEVQIPLEYQEDIIKASKWAQDRVHKNLSWPDEAITQPNIPLMESKRGQSIKAHQVTWTASRPILFSFYDLCSPKTDDPDQTSSNDRIKQGIEELVQVLIEATHIAKKVLLYFHVPQAHWKAMMKNVLEKWGKGNEFVAFQPLCKSPIISPEDIFTNPDAVYKECPDASMQPHLYLPFLLIHLLSSAEDMLKTGAHNVPELLWLVLDALESQTHLLPPTLVMCCSEVLASLIKHDLKSSTISSKAKSDSTTLERDVTLKLPALSVFLPGAISILENSSRFPIKPYLHQYQGVYFHQVVDLCERQTASDSNFTVRNILEFYLPALIEHSLTKPEPEVERTKKFMMIIKLLFVDSAQVLPIAEKLFYWLLCLDNKSNAASVMLGHLASSFNLQLSKETTTIPHLLDSAEFTNWLTWSLKNCTQTCVSSIIRMFRTIPVQQFLSLDRNTISAFVDTFLKLVDSDEKLVGSIYSISTLRLIHELVQIQPASNDANANQMTHLSTTIRESRIFRNLPQLTCEIQLRDLLFPPLLTSGTLVSPFSDGVDPKKVILPCISAYLNAADFNTPAKRFTYFHIVIAICCENPDSVLAKEIQSLCFKPDSMANIYHAYKKTMIECILTNIQAPPLEDDRAQWMNSDWFKRIPPALSNWLNQATAVFANHPWKNAICNPEYPAFHGGKFASLNKDYDFFVAVSESTASLHFSKHPVMVEGLVRTIPPQLPGTQLPNFVVDLHQEAPLCQVNHVRIGLATQEAFDLISKDQYIGVGDIPGSFAYSVDEKSLLIEGNCLSLQYGSYPSVNTMKPYRRILVSIDENRRTIWFFGEMSVLMELVGVIHVPSRIREPLYPCVSLYSSRRISVILGVPESESNQ